ncbi:hypothetical protein EUGRSUZ_E03078 [Eucalyptus grandis]|uniref:Uncharacterized protein n=2 Tax=Eucalyptus grandis TaxID=71139 RepID=A0ACC3KZJ8_EUCGR|nr:hypothetical protein EUGRSUZ_E03078 [Eucalyptus grandis]
MIATCDSSIALMRYFLSFPKLLAIHKSIYSFLVQSRVEMTEEALADICPSETEEHMVIPFHIRRSNR